jgi:hypothetical protein
LGTAALACALLAPASRACAEGWRHILERDGVNVESRWIEGSKVKEVRGTTTMSASFVQILKVLSDVENYPHLMPPTIESRLLRREGNVSFSYMVIDPPIVLKRDYCVRMELARLADGSWRSSWEMTGDGCPPPRPGLVRMVANRGSWVLTPLPSGQTRVVYVGHSDPGGAVLPSIVNMVTERSLPDIIANVRRAASLPRYAGGGAKP